jgi:DNA-binding winged helix-turn-helix (wHTH) protein/TolB-like protein
MKFGEFDIDRDAGILRRGTERVKIQDLPFRLLVILLDRPGAVLTREQLRSELWGEATFVDAEAGLNTAIAKLREALGDDAETPRFIETLPKRGYRFIGVLAGGNGAAPVPGTPAAPHSRRGVLVAAAVALVAVVGFVGYQTFAGARRISIAVVRFHNETGSPDYDRLAGTLSDAVVVALAQNSRYGVIGNSPLLTTDRIFQDVQKIGRALGADFVVLGQLQQSDAGLVIRAHFIRVSDQKHLWGGKIDLVDPSVRERTVTTALAEGVATGLRRQ